MGTFAQGCTLDVTSGSGGLGGGAGSAGGRNRFRRRLCGLLDPGDRAGDAVKALFERGDAVEQPFAVGGEHAHGFGQPPAFAGVERADRLGA